MEEENNKNNPLKNKEVKQASKSPESKHTEDTVKRPEKKETKKQKGETSPEKTEAVVNGKNLPISTKQAIAICNFIRGKYIDDAIKNLEPVVKMKKPIPMRGEIPHRKGIMSGRFPVTAAKEFIRLLNSLKANALINELELEKFEVFCMANVASRPHRRFGRTKFKRTNVQVKLIPLKKVKKGKKKSKGVKR